MMGRLQGCLPNVKKPTEFAILILCIAQPKTCAVHKKALLFSASFSGRLNLIEYVCVFKSPFLLTYSCFLQGFAFSVPH